MGANASCRPSGTAPLGLFCPLRASTWSHRITPRVWPRYDNVTTGGTMSNVEATKSPHAKFPHAHTHARTNNVEQNGTEGMYGRGYVRQRVCTGKGTREWCVGRRRAVGGRSRHAVVGSGAGRRRRRRRHCRRRPGLLLVELVELRARGRATSTRAANPPTPLALPRPAHASSVGCSRLRLRQVTAAQ